MSVSVSDPFGVASDPKMPFLAAALDPAAAAAELARVCGGRLRAVRVVRYKPGRRCLIEYDLEGDGSVTTVVGKARAKGADHTTHELTRELAAAGVPVPEPVGVVPAFGMWLQRKVPGTPSTVLLTVDGGAELARRIAESVHALHRAGVPAPRRHTVADELDTLGRRLTELARSRPGWAQRLARLYDACHRLTESIPAAADGVAHRDFYPDQVLSDGPRLVLLDFDLYAVADPALDAGNFLGHLTELAVRAGDPGRFADRERAFEDRYEERSGGRRLAVRAYALLTLARHVAISAQFPDRQPFTERLLELCEDRLGRAGALRPDRAAAAARPA